MGGVVDDIVNPIGAITGIDPVKDATGFTGTSFGPTKAQQQAAAQQGQGGSQAVSGGGGGGGSSGSAALGQLAGTTLAQQQQASQSNPFGHFGQQLAQLSNQIAPPVSASPAPSATNLAAQVTANSVHAIQSAPPWRQQQQDSFWNTSPTMNTFQ